VITRLETVLICLLIVLAVAAGACLPDRPAPAAGSAQPEPTRTPRLGIEMAP